MAALDSTDRRVRRRTPVSPISGMAIPAVPFSGATTLDTPVDGDEGRDGRIDYSEPPRVVPEDAPVPPEIPGVPPLPGKYTGFVQKNPFISGAFDTSREQDTGESAKDAFLYLANEAPPPPMQDKAALGEWFKTYVAPGMEAAGHEILGVNGDSFTFRNHQGTWIVDYGARVGGENPDLWWGANPGDLETAARFPSAPAARPSTGGGPTYGSGGGLPPGLYAPTGGGGGGGGGFSGGGGGTSSFSGTIDQAIAKILQQGGVSDDPLSQSASKALRTVIESAGALDPSVLAKRYESAVETLNRGRTGMVNNVRALLADRGLLSEGSIKQGPEASTYGRIEERLAPEFAGALRDIQVEEAQRADDRLFNSLQIATGMSAQQAETMLGALGAGVERDRTLAQVAMNTLNNNTQWNMFLANYGLDRERLFAEVQSGRMDNILPILALFMQTVNASRGGYVGDD